MLGNKACCKIHTWTEVYILSNDFWSWTKLWRNYKKKILFPDKMKSRNVKPLNLKNSISDYKTVHLLHFKSRKEENAGRISNAELKTVDRIYKLIIIGNNNIPWRNKRIKWQNTWKCWEIKGDDFIGLDLTLKSPFIW